ncbi:MAG: DNA topoisomerase I, partial [Candidatus Bathyarchaeota archaeon]|nr:DNA topoisomerase I [Candidatus Bathyarchaeota archaeon]
MEQLNHNGVLVPPRYTGKDLSLKVKGKTIKMTPEQEEMALAWAKKIGTPYIEDSVFAKNFHRDFSKKLVISVKPGDIDYSEVLSFVEKEREWKATLPREEKKQLAAQRKTQREANKERYGYAWVDGIQMEVANYVVEPSSIFMGRGKHPLRGRWKEGPREEDIDLNLSPDAIRPPGNWKTVVWQPEAIWIARWLDKLSSKMKYVWFSDSSILKQRKDIKKFDKARELRQNLLRVQRHILKNLDASDLRRRKIATVCFLIDKLKIRVGDEKDPDEADTVGASTLRPEHICSNGDGTVTFNFLGKDSVPHVFRIELPDNVIRNLKEFAAKARSTLFDGIGSKQVSEFLDEVMTGISAKVFRTCYASETVEMKLEKAPVKREDSEYEKKYVATMANLEAAKICNHRRTI